MAARAPHRGGDHQLLSAQVRGRSGVDNLLVADAQGQQHFHGKAVLPVVDEEVVDGFPQARFLHQVQAGQGVEQPVVIIAHFGPAPREQAAYRAPDFQGLPKIALPENRVGRGRGYRQGAGRELQGDIPDQPVVIGYDGQGVAVVHAQAPAAQAEHKSRGHRFLFGHRLEVRGGLLDKYVGHGQPRSVGRVHLRVHGPATGLGGQPGAARVHAGRPQMQVARQQVPELPFGETPCSQVKVG